MDPNGAAHNKEPSHKKKKGWTPKDPPLDLLLGQITAKRRGLASVPYGVERNGFLVVVDVTVRLFS